MNARDHHDAAVAGMRDVCKMLDHVVKMLDDANRHLMAAPKLSHDPGSSHLSAYLGGFVAAATSDAHNLRVLVKRGADYAENVRDHGRLTTA